MKRRVLAMLLAIVMVFGMLPMQALADEALLEESAAETLIEETEAPVEETEAPAEETEAPEEETEELPEETEELSEETESPTEEPLLEEPELLLPEETADTLLAEEAAPVVDAAEAVEVFVTISNKGVLAKTSDGELMLNKPVTVMDVDGNGILTYHEALIAAHAAYCPGGYETSDSQYGVRVDTLWGVAQSPNFYFLKNNAALDYSVGDEESTVASGDKLYAAVLTETERGADYYTYFTDETKSVKAGEEFTLTLMGFGTLSGSSTPEAISGISVGTWDDGSFAAIEGKSTDASGQVTLSFDRTGTYYVTAKGTVPADVPDWSTPEDDTVNVDCPTMAPVCVVTVEGEYVPVTAVTLDKTEATVKAGYTVTLTATVTPDNANDTTVTWTSSDESVATVADGVVSGVGAGTAVISAKAGGCEASCTVTSVMPTFSELAIYASQSAYLNGEAPLALTPAYDPDTNSYVIDIPDHAAPAQSWETQTVYLVATAAEDSRDGYGLMYSSSAWGWGSGRLTDGVLKTNLVFMNKGYADVYFAAKGSFKMEAHYQFTSQYHTTLSALTIDGVLDQAFNRNVTRYHAYVDSTADGVKIVPTAFKSGYTVTINGTEVTSGEEYTLAYDWKGGSKMDVEIVVSGDGYTTTTYTIELEKAPLNDVPFVMTQPVEADYIQNDTSKALSVIASANGEMTYQWYSNAVDSTEGGTPIDGATGTEYTPSTAEIGTVYYYCVITNTGRTEGNITASNTARVTVDPDPTPVVEIVNPGDPMPEDGYDYPWNTGYVYAPGDESTPLKVEATSAAEGGTWSYTWYESLDGAYDIWSYATLQNATSSTYTPDTSLSQANDKGRYYYCEVTYTFKGKTYTALSTTGDTYYDEDWEETYDVNAAYVFIKVDSAAAPTFTKQPASAEYTVGASAKKLTATASRADRGTLTYQWYVSDTDSFEDAAAIEGATKNSYTLGTVTEPGTKYYYCVVTNTIQGYTASTVSDAAQIKVNVANTLEGEGTADAPWEVWTAEDYQMVYDLVSQGNTFEGQYLKQMADITLPDDWAPIGITRDGTHNVQSGDNLLPFSGTLDGSGMTLTIPEGGLPLLGYVKGAAVKNLNIYGEKIAGYGLVNYLEGVGLSGEAICIDNVTLKSGSSTLKSGLIGTYITTNGFAGCSADFYVTIRNCTIEDGVVVGYNRDQAMIGSIAGRVHGTIENCVSYAAVYGTDYVGGILGTRDNAMGICAVTGCTFAGTVEATGEHVGGIVGGGYENSTAPNGIKVTVNDNTVTGSVTGKDKVGGILGGDSYVAQAWNPYSIKSNVFTGTVSATGGTYVGGIIGYYKSLNKIDDIAGNYYSCDCGTDKGIGFVQYIDTSSTTHETESGAVYFNTENGTDGCPQVNGCWWKTAHNRTDDPLGTDAAKLCVSTNAVLAAGSANEVVGGKSITLKAVDSETGKAVKASEVRWYLADSDDAAYATISTAGVLKTYAVAAKRDVTLIAELSGNHTGRIKHTVTIYPSVTHVEIWKGEENVTGKTLYLSAAADASLDLTGKLFPTDAKEGIAWKSSNIKVAKVADGKVTYAGKAGTVTITATAKDGSGKKASVTVQVGSLTTEVKINAPASTTLRSGASLTLKAETTPVKPTVAGVTFALVKPADSAYATVSASGKVTAKTVNEPHEIQIVATSKDAAKVQSEPLTLTILPKSQQMLILKSGNDYVTGKTLVRNTDAGTISLSAFLLDTADAVTETTPETLTWTTSKGSVASVDNGIVTLHKAGTAVITAVSGKLKASVTVKVTSLVSGITVETKSAKDNLIIASGKAVALKATAAPTSAANKKVAWSITDGAAYAKISSSGVLTANKDLTKTVQVTVTATAVDGSGVAGSAVVTINPIAQGIRILRQVNSTVKEPTNTTLVWDMVPNNTLNLSAKVYPSAAEQDVTWSSSNVKAATIGQDGKVTCIKAGTTTITATAKDGSGKKASFKLTVVKRMTELTLSGNDFIAGGKSLTLKAGIAPTDTTNKKLTWSISANDVGAKISSSGKLTTKAVKEPVTVTVTAAAQDGSGKMATHTVTIYPATTKVTLTTVDGETVPKELAAGTELELKGFCDGAANEYTWKSNNKYVTVTGGTVVADAKAVGKTVTITCTAADGTGKSASVKIKIVTAEVNN